MANIAWFKELSKQDIPLVGGKAANLGEMFNAGIPVPPGFVVTAEAYKHFLEVTGIADEIYDILKDLNVEDNTTLQSASKKVQEIIVKAGMPRDIERDIKENYDNLNVDEDVFRTAGKQALDIIKAGRELPFVAVRSSATAEDLPTASFAGQQATFLNIRGGSKLAEAVQKCWASLFTARAIYYRVKNNFPHEKVFIAVVVQKMVKSDKCLHPDTFIQSGNGEVITIRDQVEQMRSTNLISADLPNFRIENSKCIRFNRIQPPKWLYKIITRTGEIISTGNHRFFVLDCFKMKEKKAKYLSSGERIGAARKIKIKGCIYKFPEIFRFKYYKISEKGLEILYQKRKEKSVLKEISKVLNVNFSGIRDLETGIYRFSENKLKKLCNYLDINFDNFIEKYATITYQKTHQSKISIPEQTSPELCQILGYLLGDAYIRGKSSLILTDKDKKNLEVYRKLIKKVFNLNGVIKIDGERQRLLIHSKELVRFLRKNCSPMLRRSPQRAIPLFIQRLPNNQIATFIRGLYDAEGNVKNDLKITMSSSKTIFVLKHLLLRFGIIGHIKKVKDVSGFGKDRTYFLLNISGNEDIKDFHRHINFSSSEKKEHLKKIVQKLKKRKEHSLTKTCSIDKKLLRNVISKLGFKKKMRDFQSCLYYSNTSFPLLKKIYERLKKRSYEISQLKINQDNFFESRKKLKIPRKDLCPILNCSEKLLEKIEKKRIKKSKVEKEEIIRLLKEKQEEILKFTQPLLNDLKNILNKDIFFDEIRSVERIPSDVDWLYDLTINPHANYMANGYLTHNSGVIFSVNPMTNNEKEMVIEAGWGLGEAVVSGSINPDQYIIEKGTLTLKSKKINEQDWMYTLDPRLGHTIKKNVAQDKINMQILNDVELRKLSELTVKLEHHYGSAQDIEYAIEGSGIFIVQSRPVTTLKKPAEAKKEEVEKEEAIVAAAGAEVLVQGVGASPGVGSGPVKIVHGIEGLGKIQKGDVLVARMTNPDYVSTMQKASAIVTDAGGSTCFSRDTKILTKTGFFTLEKIYNLVNEGEDVETLSLDTKSNKVIWRKIIAASKRRGKLNKIQISPSLRSKQNFLNVTLDHKFLTLNDRALTKKSMKNILGNSEAILIADKIPKINKIKPIDFPSYLAGAIFSDGSLSINNRGGYDISFHQTNTPQKEDFINKVVKDFEAYYEEPFKLQINKNRPDQHQYRCFKKNVYRSLIKVKENIIENILSMDENSLVDFLSGFIDGDGSAGDHQLMITVGEAKKKFLEGIVCACLRLGIMPCVHKQKNWYVIHLTEKINNIINNCKRIHKNYPTKRFGHKQFLSKSVIGDIIDKVNHRGRVKSPYIKKNLMISDKYLKNTIIPRIPEKRKEILNLLNSDFRMWRCKLEESMDYQDVYNLTIDAEIELDHNYIVFTSNYSPVIVGNCHAAIVSREMGIPCIVGTETATQELQENEIITVDANSGKVYKGKITIEKEKEAYEMEQAPLETVTDVKVIMDLPDFAEKAAKTGADGVGLLRCEFMILKHKEHPYYMITTGRREELIQELTADITKIATAFKGKPVWYRTLDAPTDEFRHMKGGEDEPEEDNPMMGWRSIRRSLDQPELLLAEFEAIKRVHDSGLTNVGVMLPLVTHIEQIVKSKEYLKKVGLEPMENIEFGVMIETPASVQIIEEICKEGVDYVSFGTNDLTQFTLACDRNSAKVQKWYNEKHPAILRQIKHVVEICKKYNVETSICGQAGSDPEMAEFLVKMGIDSISANPDAVKKIRYTVAKIEKKLLLNVARKDVQL